MGTTGVKPLIITIINEIIQNIRSLNPNLRSEEQTVTMVFKLMNLVPQIVPPRSSADIIDEWRLHKLMDIPAIDDWHTSSDGVIKRIDEFWNRVFQTKDNI